MSGPLYYQVNNPTEPNTVRLVETLIQTQSSDLCQIVNDMQHLPVELATKIFALACFDDKATGRALTLTSTWIAQAAEPVRFDAVSLYDLDQIVEFGSMVKRLPPGEPKIRHLFVSGIGLQKATDGRTWRNLSLRKEAIVLGLLPVMTMSPGDLLRVQSSSGKFERSRLWYKTQQKAFDKAFHGILKTVGGLLEVLFITDVPSRRLAIPIQSPLPNLTSISSTNSCYNFYLPHPLPKLRRLHTNARLGGLGKEMDYRRDTPVLEEIRLSDVDDRCEDCLDALVQHSRFMRKEEAKRLVFPPTLKRAMFQQDAPLYGAECGSTYLDWSNFGEILDYYMKLVEESNGGFRLVILESMGFDLWIKGAAAGLRYCFDDARKDWKDVISGGDGCWNDLEN